MNTSWKGKGSMKAKSIIKQATLVALGVIVVGTVGCTTWRADVRRATDVAVVDASPNASNKGYAEFYTLSTNFPVPIFLLDDRGKAFHLASVGLPRGERFSTARNGRVAAEKLRVALPAGNHMFMIENNGQYLQVPITEGQVTPVEID
jgi:hypothetical protein